MKINLGNVVALLPFIQVAMQKAQAIKGATGPEKQKAAIEDFSATAIQAIEAGADRDVIDDRLVLAATASVMEALKNFENVVADAKARHARPPAA